MGEQGGRLTVLYDGDCPLCAREIAFYRRQAGAECIEWRDIGISGDGQCPSGIARGDAIARFHVVGPNGDVTIGGDAFCSIWSSLPAFRRLGYIARKPLCRWVLNGAYSVFLKLRPVLQMIARSAVRDEAAAVNSPPGTISSQRQ